MADDRGIVRRKDSVPQRLGARKWFVLRLFVAYVAATVGVFAAGITDTGVAFLITVPVAVALAALVQLGAQKLGMNPPKLDLARREPDIRIPATGSTPVPLVGRRRSMIPTNPDKDVAP